MKERVASPVALSVVLVCVSLRGGGTERIVCRLANFLAKRWSVSIVTLAYSEPFYAVDKAVRIRMPPPRWRHQMKAVRPLLQIGHVYRCLRDVRPAVCLIFGEDIAAPIAKTARMAGGPKVAVFPRGTPSRSIKGIKGKVNAVVYRSVDQVVVQTQEARLAMALRFPTASLQVIPNPIELPLSCRPQKKRENWIVCVGSLGRQKNQEALIRVFARLKNARKWHLVFVGEGPDRARLEIMAKASGVVDRIRFVGEQANVSEWLNRARIFAFPSLSEGFPNALAEAMAAGCACISYDCPTGPGDLIEHDHNGLLVPNDDETAFQRQLERLVNDSELQAELSNHARKDIQRFSADHVLEQFERLIQTMAQQTDRLQATSCD